MSHFLSEKTPFLMCCYGDVHGVRCELAVWMGGGTSRLSCHPIVSVFTDDLSSNYKVRPTTLLFSRF
jgi:hypothetical protein